MRGVLAFPRLPYSRIADYGAIGDGRSVALVSREGSIDWWCPGRFDGPSVFAACLDGRVGGRFRVAPTASEASSTFAYVSDTNVLETTHATPGGEARVVDFAVHAADLPVEDSVLVRRVACTRGSIEIAVVFEPRFQYGRAPARVTHSPMGLVARGSGEILLLTGPTGRIQLRAGESFDLVLRHQHFDAPVPFARSLGATPAELEARTLARWRAWSAKTRVPDGRDAPLVRRAALALKLLQDHRTGAIVAAATTSLPEAIGGVRNWDYRYAWVRDGVLAARALADAGHEEEADAFAAWLARVLESGELKVLYSVGGEHELPESVLHHLEGHRESRPVRIGNAAVVQRQLDVYGELFHFYAHRGAPPVARLAALADWVAANWREPDSGIWEVRCDPKHFVLSKAMAWAALDHAARLPGIQQERASAWAREAERVREDVLANGVRPHDGAFVQAYGAHAHLDASNLLLPLIGFIDAKDARMVSTVEATLSDLTVDGLVYRYLGAEDGVGGAEATFAYCAFWLVEVLAMQGRVRDARALFDKLAARATSLGLYAEEIDAASGEHLGNFPQAFPHAGLIQAARALEKGERAARDAAA